MVCWGTNCPRTTIRPVSYTHLDVYKRQGIIYRPIREKKAETLFAQARELLQNSGYDEIGLLSLSTADYSCVGELVDGLLACLLYTSRCV